ncbi:MFS transporter [Hyphomonas sp.]|uniref:MFS transporter n=1 Tax=Hyphomonas sp. TaxID=87 RepID=UPI00391CC550
MRINDAWRAAISASIIHLVMGANLPYLPVWMERVGGMSGAEIAGASTLAILIRIIAGPLAAGIAQQRGLRGTLAATMLVAFAGYALLYPEAPRAVDFALCVLIYTAMNVAGPLFEAILVYGTKGGRPDYGEARAMVSLAFVVANLAGGAVLAAFGPDWILHYLLAAAAASVFAPLFTRRGARTAVARSSLVSTFRDGIALFRPRGVFAFILAAALIQASHGAYYAFGSNIWIAQGIAPGHIGALWATGVFAEIVLLILSTRLLGRLSPYLVLILGGFGAIIRWSGTGLILPVETIYVLQLLHAASFALTHLATMRFLQMTLPEQTLPLAYAVNSALVFGPALALAGFLAGLAYDGLAPGGIAAQTKLYWIMSALSAAGFLLALAASRKPVAARVE